MSRSTYFWNTAVPCGSGNSQNVVQLNSYKDKHYFVIPYPTLQPLLKKFSHESVHAIARNPNIELQYVGHYSRSDLEHHIKTR